jgi:hypothetical protein
MVWRGSLDQGMLQNAVNQPHPKGLIITQNGLSPQSKEIVDEWTSRWQY